MVLCTGGQVEVKIFIHKIVIPMVDGWLGKLTWTIRVLDCKIVERAGDCCYARELLELLVGRAACGIQMERCV
jgi:hypothetical protein